MALTEEQKEMIKRNRERALAIRKRKLAEQQQNSTESVTTSVTCRDTSSQPGTNNLTTSSSAKRQKTSHDDQPPSTTTTTKTTSLDNNNKNDDDYDSDPNLPPTITKKDATTHYCLPPGTIAVCHPITTKDNPRRKGWAPMTLYDRAEIRRRAYERYGGREGLREERRKREERRFRKDWEKAKDIFKMRK